MGRGSTLVVTHCPEIQTSVIRQPPKIRTYGMPCWRQIERGLDIAYP